MESLTNPRNAIGDRADPQSAWWKLPADAYLDHRHRNWVLAEEVGDVIFVPSAHVVLVHRERAEHIADLLGGRDGVLLEEVLALSARTGIGVVPRATLPMFAAASAVFLPGSPRWWSITQELPALATTLALTVLAEVHEFLPHALG